MIDGNYHNSIICNRKASPCIGVAGYNTNFKAFTALGQVEEPDDIGEVVAFLSSSALMMLIGLQHNGLKFQEE